MIREAVAAGIRDLGENRVQEAEGKRRALHDLTGVTWHMVGHLQTNKIKTAMGLFDIIHSVDSFHLADAISRRSVERLPIFLEVNVAREPNKYGFSIEELRFEFERIARLPHVDVRGLMAIAPQTRDFERVRSIFRTLKEAARTLGLSELSMGMSDDFQIAVEEGATHLRIGRAIFGERS
jgi:pyridoxal phosphate enzyme (YggS family)